jgi:AcrR family transcriptional regulator
MSADTGKPPAASRLAGLPLRGASPFNRTAQHEAKRTEILSQAARLFNTRGSRSATLLDIARTLGLTKTSLYYYVKTKEELIYQCYLAALARHEQTLAVQEEAGVAGLTRIEGFIRQHFADRIAARSGDAPHFAALLEIASLNELHRTEVERRYIDMFRRLRQCLRDGIADGSVRRCETTAATLALLGALDWSFDWLRSLDANGLAHAADDAWALLSSGLAAAPSAAAVLSEVDPAPTQPGARGFDREQQKLAKQEAFYQTGTWCFNRKGFDGTSLDEIAEQLQVTKGAFYYHIRNKEDLLYQCYNRSLDIIAAIHADAATAPDGLRRLAHTCRRVFAVQNSSSGPLIRYTSITSLPIERRRDILERTESNNHCFGQFIRDGIDDGSVRAVNPLIAENLLAGAINASMDIELWRRVDDIDSAGIEYFDLFFNGLAAPDGAP